MFPTCVQSPKTNIQQHKFQENPRLKHDQPYLKKQNSRKNNKSGPKRGIIITLPQVKQRTGMIILKLSSSGSTKTLILFLKRRNCRMLWAVLGFGAHFHPIVHWDPFLTFSNQILNQFLSNVYNKTTSINMNIHWSQFN